MTVQRYLSQVSGFVSKVQEARLTLGLSFSCNDLYSDRKLHLVAVSQDFIIERRNLCSLAAEQRAWDARYC